MECAGGLATISNAPIGHGDLDELGVAKATDSKIRPRFLWIGRALKIRSL